ncbi:MAG: cellulase family glycosylhydrolase [Anaerolineae bacterium]|nr:cellulase family glycosylhydrolase [Anaerolineae bacterium]
MLSLLILLAALAGSAAGQGSGLIEDFEDSDVPDRWWYWAGEGAAAFTCEPGQPAHGGAYALRLSFDLPADVYAGCGTSFATRDWRGADGVRFWWRSDAPGTPVSLLLGVDDPTQTNPDQLGVTLFTTTLEAPGDTWIETSLTWESFVKPEWMGEAGITVFDPSRIVSVSFDVGDWQAGVHGTLWIDDLALLGTLPTPTAPPPTPVVGAYDKFALWVDGPHLRGANIWQRVVVPWVDGPEFLGSGHVGPPYTQEDFDRLAALGANYVNISGPGLFTEQPPYVLDEAVQANLDNLLAMIARADLFAVISFRTGPGRSDFTFYDDNIEEWGDRSLVVEHVWADQAAQDAWAEMWGYAAARYRDNPIVVGYDLMVEPNSAGRLLEIWEPADFYPAYAGTLYDWNRFYPAIVQAIRAVDTQTPILAGALGWSGVRWLAALQPVDDPRIVYTVHQYEPQAQYTHQEPPAANAYPGVYDVTYDGVPDVFDRAWLDAFLAPVDAFQARYGVPVAVNEFGVERWVSNAADFMRDELALFEQRGMNNALWVWNPAWEPWSQSVDGFDLLHGPDPANHAAVSNDLLEVVRAAWSQNILHPSTFAP